MADARSISRAAPVRGVYRLTLGGTWAGADSITITIGNASMTMTLANASSTSTIAQAIEAAFNASSRDYNKIDDESVDVAGQEINQFAELVAVWESTNSYVDFQMVEPGKPATIVTTKSSAAGTVSDTTQQTPTGPKFWDNVNNWHAGAVPTNSDSVFLENGVDFRYGLPNNSLQIARLVMVDGQLGLPAINRDNPSRPYTEYRQLAATFDDDALLGSTKYTFGRKPGVGPTFASIHQTTDSIVATIYGTAPRAGGDTAVHAGERAVNLTGGDATSECRIISGSVSIAPYYTSFAQFGVMRIGVKGSNDHPDVFIGEGATLTADGAFEVESGVVDNQDNTRYVNIFGGTVTMSQGAASNCEIYVENATLFLGTEQQESMGTITLASGGRLDTSLANKAFTITACELHAGYALIDHGRRLTFAAGGQGFDFNNCGVADGTFHYGVNYRLEPQTIA